MKQEKLVVAIGGASGVHLGLRLIENIPDSIELYVVVSEGAKNVAKNELGIDILTSLNAVSYTHLTLPTIYPV